MENEYLVNEFLDGTLDAAGEEKFFSMLAAESELRNELKQQLAIKNAVRADVKAFTPKAESTLQIFDKLGLVVPLATVSTAGNFVGGTTFSTFVKANTGYILTSLASIAVTAIILLNMMNTDSKNTISTTENIGNTSESLIINEEQIPEELNSLNKSPENIPEKIVYKYIYVNDSKTQSKDDYFNANQEEVIINNENFATIKQSNFQRNNFKEFNLPSKQESNFNQSFPLNNYFVPNIGNDKRNFKIELRGSEYFNKDLAGVQTTDYLLLNSGFSALYNFSEELSFGFDIRRERFSQEFSGKEGENYFLYKQEPNFQTYSLVAKYNPSYAVWEVFSPFIFAGAGGNSSGPVGRFMVGTDMNVSNNYYLTFGLDYNILLYSQTGAYYIAPKFGAHFGAGIKF